jgi:hypothetical protein
MIGWSAHFQVSGLSDQEPGTGAQVQVRVQEICPLSSIQSSTHSGWQVAAPGGRWRVFHSVLHSALNAVLRDLSSIQSSTHSRWQVAAPGGRWRVFHSVLHSVLNAVLRDLSSIQPYPRQTRSARSADPTRRQALPRYSILDTPYSRYSVLHSALCGQICHRFSHLSSTQSSTWVLLTPPHEDPALAPRPGLVLPFRR